MVRWEAHLFDAVMSGKVKGQDCCPPHWLSTGLRRSSSTCLATSMVSSRSKSPSASSIESLLPQCRCYISRQQHASGCTCTHQYHHYPIMGVKLVSHAIPHFCLYVVKRLAKKVNRNQRRSLNRRWHLEFTWLKLIFHLPWWLAVVNWLDSYSIFLLFRVFE